jgi:hypothetical protein
MLSLRTFRLLSACVLLASTAICSAFTAEIRHAGWVSQSRTSSLSAYYYGMEPNDEGENASEEYSSTATAGRLNSERASLARVVAAFPPVGHHLGLKNIADVKVLNVDSSHMELQAIVCENESCSALDIPVPFPHPCSSGSETLHECALHNLDELDHEAELLLKQAEWESTNYELHAEQTRQHLAILEHDHIHYPSWWVTPEMVLHEMTPECDSMRNLLNEEGFQPKTRAMAKFGLGTDNPVEEAAVCAVGPAGIILRARLQGAPDIVEVPISFPSQASSIDQLRDLVTGAVEFAGTL